jgi:hypothetical protein
MELIPILSTIVLVATISTFLLAIGAYILFKIREKKGTYIYPKQPSCVEAELIAPIEEKEEIKPVKAEENAEPKSIHPIIEKEKQKSTDLRFQEYKKEGIKIKEPEEQKKGEDIPDSIERTKFLKYTSEGYVPPKEDKDSGAMRWR